MKLYYHDPHKILPYGWAVFTDAVTKETTVIYRNRTYDNRSSFFHFVFMDEQEAGTWLAEVEEPTAKLVHDKHLLRVMGRAYEPVRLRKEAAKQNSENAQ